MAEDLLTLNVFYAQWKAYQDHIIEAVAPLTPEQLNLRAAPDLRSIGENAEHIIGCRIGWFTETLGEEGSEFVKAWEESEHTVHSAHDLALALDATWQLMANCLARWSPSDMQQTFPDDWEGTIVQLSRAWVVWHVLEHDLHHGGEIALALGMHKLKSAFTS